MVWVLKVWIAQHDSVDNIVIEKNLVNKKQIAELCSPTHVFWKQASEVSW